MKQIIDIIAKTLGIGARQIEQTLGLLDGGATIPFIARYRKEATGGLDEVQKAEVAKQNEKFKELIHRKEYILQTIEEQGKLTNELKERISTCWDATNWRTSTCPTSPSERLVPRWLASVALIPWRMLYCTVPMVIRSNMPRHTSRRRFPRWQMPCRVPGTFWPNA